MEKRRVKVSKYGKWDAELRKYPLINDGVATFCGWGCDYEEFENGPGNYSTAIIERDDGRVENVPVERIIFIV